MSSSSCAAANVSFRCLFLRTARYVIGQVRAAFLPTLIYHPLSHSLVRIILSLSNSHTHSNTHTHTHYFVSFRWRKLSKPVVKIDDIVQHGPKHLTMLLLEWRMEPDQSLITPLSQSGLKCLTHVPWPMYLRCSGRVCLNR